MFASSDRLNFSNVLEVNPPLFFWLLNVASAETRLGRGYQFYILHRPLTRISINIMCDGIGDAPATAASERII